MIFFAKLPCSQGDAPPRLTHPNPVTPNATLGSSNQKSSIDHRDQIPMSALGLLRSLNAHVLTVNTAGFLALISAAPMPLSLKSGWDQNWRSEKPSQRRIGPIASARSVNVALTSEWHSSL